MQTHTNTHMHTSEKMLTQLKFILLLLLFFSHQPNRSEYTSTTPATRRITPATLQQYVLLCEEMKS